MSSSLRLIPWLVAAACAASGAVHAQSSTNTQKQRDSFIPYTQQGYFGLSGGRSNYDLNAGPAGTGLGFDDSDSAWKLSTGGYFHPNAGVELSYLNAGKAHRLGGTTKAQGVNLSLIGRAPLNEQFDLFGKVGTTYGRTRTSGFSGLGVNTGKDSGFGLSYGLGARWNFNQQWAAVVEWERHKFHFADDNSGVKMTTLGVQYKY
ncbi:outer membrane beta-barrel protein [Acidovorax sp.]|jgi:opacity protein-like surface antigen|uniref:outer membrane beta-barrel protein n=1 Tax=Acidovorax sp. TaxID=1872122 RepID=UPI00391F974C